MLDCLRAVVLLGVDARAARAVELSAAADFQSQRTDGLVQDADELEPARTRTMVQCCAVA